MVSTLSMPSAAVEAARTFGASELGLTPGMAEDDLEQRIMLLTKGPYSYGVAQAVLSGQRLRLFHELNPSSGTRVNCGEFGIAAFTMYNAFSKMEAVQVLRYRPFANGSYHFGLVRGDGKDDSVIVDPLINLHGKIRLNNNGFVFYPFSWLDSHSIDETSSSTVPLLEGGEKRDGPLRVISDLTFLDEDTLLRHVNLINSPLGFLAYFADGQRLEETVSDDYAISYSAEIGEEGLIVRATSAHNTTAPFYTVERLFPFEGIDIAKERELLHHGINWVRPDKLLYSRTNGREEIRVWPDPEQQASTLDLFIGASGRMGPLFAPEDTKGYLRGLEQMLEGWRGRAPEFGEGLRALSDKGLNYWEATDVCELVRELESFVSLQRNDTDADRQENLNSILNHLHFGRYAKGLTHKWPEQEVLKRFRSVADKGANLFGSSIKAYFESPVVAALLQQYQETVKVVVQNRHVFEQHTTA